MDDDVVEVGQHIGAPELLDKEFYEAAVGCTCVLRPEGHPVEGEESPRCGEGEEWTALWFHRDGVVGRGRIQSGEDSASLQLVEVFLDVRQGIGIRDGASIEPPVVYCPSDGFVFLKGWD